MSWTRPNNWNGPGQFHYDSADLPFTAPSSNETVPMSNDQSTLAKLFSVAGSFSHEDLSSAANSNSNRGNNMLSFDSSATADDYKRLTQSLPATPLSTPASTPAPTPQSSPLIHRKGDVDPVSLAADRCVRRLATVPETSQAPATNNKWYYLGFFPQGGQPATARSLVVGEQDEVDGKSFPGGTRDPQSCRRKCAPLISNRDMNFFAPTSM